MWDLIVLVPVSMCARESRCEAVESCHQSCGEICQFDKQPEP